MAHAQVIAKAAAGEEGKGNQGIVPILRHAPSLFEPAREPIFPGNQSSLTHHYEARAVAPTTHAPPAFRVPDVMNLADPSVNTATGQAARDEELRGECAKAFEYYKQGNLRQGTQLLLKLLAWHPAHPVLRYAYWRLSHMQLLEQRRSAGVMKQIDECRDRAVAARKACSSSLLPSLLFVQILYDYPIPDDEALGAFLDIARTMAAQAAARPLATADLQHAKVIATFDDEVFTLALFPDVRECADPAAYRAQALANLAKAPAKITDLHREAVNLARSEPRRSQLDHYLALRDAGHAAEAVRRLQRVQARAVEEEADRALAAIHRVMAGEGAAHDLQMAAPGWRESADQGDASAQLGIGALLARGGGGVKRNQPLGKRYLELSAAAGNEAAVTLLKELRKCVGCGELDVHHMICSQCRDARYCDDDCQQRHCQCPTHPHKLNCVPRRELAGAGGASDHVEPPGAHLDLLKDQIAAAAAARAAGNDLFREQKYPEVWQNVNLCNLW